jgi:hypothetical protein
MPHDLRQTSIFDTKPIVQRDNAATRLRALLSDGRWHSATELQAVAGRRYGARLMEIRRGEDGRPALEVEGEPTKSGDCEWRYRVSPGTCPTHGRPVTGANVATGRQVCAACRSEGRAA